MTSDIRRTAEWHARSIVSGLGSDLPAPVLARLRPLADHLIDQVEAAIRSGEIEYDPFPPPTDDMDEAFRRAGID